MARRRFSLCLIGLPLLGLEPPLLAGVLVGGDVVDALEHLDEVGDVLKAGAAADGLDGFAVGEHEAGVGNAHAVEVVHVGDAGVALEVALKNLLVGGVLIQELVQPAAADPQVVLYMDISISRKLILNTYMVPSQIRMLLEWMV